MSALLGDAVYRSASFFRRSPLALGRWLPTFRAMAVSSVLKNSHSRTIPRRMPAHVGAGVPANINVHRGLSRSTYDSHRGEYYVDELLATQTSASNNDISGYTLCANEWDSFALPSTCDVAYGAKGAFVFRSAQSGTIAFNNATFGDPAPGAPKKGYYRLSGGQRFYAHANHLYSVAAMTNAAGAVVERYRYSSYGERTVLAADGITVRAASSYGQQIGFTGRYQDKETSLWYFRARYYSGTLGRFIGRDPIGYTDGMGLYNGYFVPNGLDPSGTINDGSGYPIFGPDGSAPIVKDLPDWPAMIMDQLTAWRGAVGEGLPRTLLDQWYYRRGDINLTVGQVEELWIRETMKKVVDFNADVAKAANSGRFQIWKKTYEYPLFTVGRSRTLGQIGGMKLSSTVIVCNEKWWVVGELSLSDKYDFDPRPPGQRHVAAEQMVIIMNKIHQAGFGKDFTASASGVPFSQDYTMDKMKIGSGGGGGDPGTGGGIPPVVQ
jgi:RHS repeat-associated protein